MQRRPEPELMLDPAQASAYARADFQEMNQGFVAFFGFHCAPEVPPGGRVIDLGCGPGDIALQLARRHPELHIDAVDGSTAMLELACAAYAQLDAAASAPVRFLQTTVPDDAIERRVYHAVISNSFLHHLHDPAVLWQTVIECGKPGAAVLVMDLVRPPSLADAQYIVDTYAGREPAVLREDFYSSLCAAFTPQEIQSQLTAAGLDHFRVRRVGGRHVSISGYLRD